MRAYLKKQPPANRENNWEHTPKRRQNNILAPAIAVALLAGSVVPITSIAEPAGTSPVTKAVTKPENSCDEATFGQVHAASVIIKITAEVATVDDSSGLLGGSINVGDTLTGCYSYETTTPDTNSSPTVGDYRHSSPQFGITINGGGFVFETDPANVDFLVEIVNDHGTPARDNYLLRSYNNLPLSNGAFVEHISWQLDDPTLSALSSATLPLVPPNLSDWQSNFGLTIRGCGAANHREFDCDIDGQFFVRAHVTSAKGVINSVNGNVTIPEPEVGEYKTSGTKHDKAGNPNQPKQPSAIYVTSAKDFRVVPLIKGSLPDLNKGIDLVVSAPCQTNAGNIYPLSNGGFLTLWWNGETKKHCYSRFTPDGKGSFTEKVMGDWDVSGSWPLLPTDLNGDQQDDLIFIKRIGSGYHSLDYQAALGKSDGRFEFIGTPVEFVAKQWSGSLTVADADGDGHADFIFYTFSSGGSEPTNLYMLKGQGDGTFATNKTPLLNSPHGANAIVVADFNEDGYPDVFLSPDDDVADEGQAHIAFGKGNGEFNPVTESIDFVPSDEGRTGDTFFASANAYDVNLDGHIDIIANEYQIGIKTTKKVYWGDGSGQFSTTGEELFSAPKGTPYHRIIWLAATAFTTGDYTASGTIHDKEGNPIADVTVQVGDKTTVTDATGYWEINSLAEDEYQVTASKDDYTFPVKECVLGNNENCRVTIKAGSVLTAMVIPEPRTAKQGENVTYTITVTNEGDEKSTGVLLTDSLPEGTTLVSIEALDGGSCEAETVMCRLPDLTPGAMANVKVVVSNSQTETLINTVTVTTQEYPTDVKKTWTQVIPYLSVTVTDLPDPIEMQKVLHYSLAVELSHYAPTDATGISLVSQLPKGVELKSINSDYSVCDTSALPKITCQMNDLSIASADSVSHATVEMDVTLKDAGLLLLTHEAKVTANEYPAHTDRERTQIFIPDGIEVDLAFVIDVTGSMQEEMNGTMKALKEFIAEIEARTALLEITPLMALITFRDEVKVAAFTRDLSVLVNAIEQLKAEGGGTCPEASVEALLIAIPHTKEGGDILFSTDASPYPDAEVEKVTELLRSKGIRFNTMITGDCSQESSWNELP
jgi:uncharacterized repeat protein (TIGR01451 family)